MFQYSNRPSYIQEISLFQYIKMSMKKQKTAKPKAFKIPRIIHPVGMSGNPTFSPSDGYAKTTLILHEPWSITNRLSFEHDPQQLFPEFDNFMRSPHCPVDVLIKYEIAFEKSERTRKNKECSNDQDNTAFDIDDPSYPEAAPMLIQSCQSFHKSTILHNLDRGLDYDWSQRHFYIAPEILNNCHPSERLNNIISQHNLRKQIQRSKTREPPDSSLIANNPEQQMVVFSALKKIREWVEFPNLYKTNPNITLMKPLHMTIQGKGGTGKTT